MKIVIIGTGDVGTHVCQILSNQGHDVTAIDQNENIAEELDAAIDAHVFGGDGCSAEVLMKAGVDNADYLLTLTNDDRTNLIASSIGKALGAKHTIARIHDQVYNESSIVNYQLHFNVDYFVQPEALCAAELAKQIKNPARVAVESFARGYIEVQQVLVSKASVFIGKPLSHLQLSKEMRFVYLIRNKELIIPTGNTTLQPGDLATIVASSEDLLRIREKLNPESVPDIQQVFLFKGTETSTALLRLLNPRRYQCHLIEDNERICKRFAERFPDLNVIQGDGTSRALLEEQQVRGSDFFISCGKDDEDNIMTGIQAIDLGAKHVQIVIHRTDYEPVLNSLKKSLKLGQAVSPRVVATKEILRCLSPEPYQEIATLPYGAGKIWEIKVGYHARAAGHLVKDLVLPKPSIFAALTHKFHVKVPTATDKILGGDRLIIVSKEEFLPDILEVLSD